jgi:hypothetical protein
MSKDVQALRELILQLVPADGSTIGNQALIADLKNYLPELSDAEYHAAKDALVVEGMLMKGRGRGGSVSLTGREPRLASAATQIRPKPALNSEYAEVNSALNDYFFHGRFEMLPVYLDLEGDAETELTEALEMDPDELGDFIGLCAAQSLRFDKTDPYSDHVEWLKDWSRTGRHEPPPFTALLAALSIAAERMGADQNFSPNNYYERLFELLGVKGATNQQKLKLYAKSTRQFWRALNLWLSENDFLLGRPTARALISHWQYASYALSQALVRDADRNRFAGLFESYDLVPGDPVPEAEMVLLVHDWMTSHGPTGPTAWLRKLWAANELRERVVAAALDAFETWEKSTATTADGSRNARLQWQLGFTGFPGKRARLSLVVTRGGQEEALQPVSSSGGVESGLFLEGGIEAGSQFLGPLQSLNLDLLLLQSRKFTGAESGISYNYVAKPIVPLARSPDGPAYREVSRVSLFDEHAILCHEAWLEKVEGHLSKCARLGYAVLRAQDMHGIPEGWCILRGVEVVRSVDGAHDNLHALNPIGSTAAIACVDGLKLGHGTWHADARPTVEATSEKPDCTLEVVRERFGDPDELLVASKANGDFMEAALSTAEIAPGTNLRAVVKAKGTEFAETSFSLRSADVPRPLGKKRFFHPAVEGKGFSLEQAVVGSGPLRGLEGCFLHGELGSDESADLSAKINNQEDIPAGSPEVSPEADWQRSSDAAQKASESCVIRGYHYWILEPFQKGDDRFDAKMAECKNCHIRALSRSREVAKGNWKKIRQQDQPVPKRKRQSALASGQVEGGSNEDTFISLDTVYDGLCYLGQGTWGAFQRLVAGASQEPWFSYSFANDLFALGHLESVDAFQSTTTDWSVPPPVLVISLDNKARLAGFHSKALIERIDSVLTREGAIYDPVSAPGCMTAQRWSGLAGLDLEALLKGIVDPHGRPVAIARGLGGIIASQLPSFDEAWALGMPIHVEKSDGLAKFDVQRARWTSLESPKGPGAYRVGLHGTRYFYRDADGTSRQVGHRIAKVLAARAEDTKLHGYDISTGKFTAALGVDPPGLFARALVASSGMLPTVEDGRLIYLNVDPLVAAMVLNKMYGKD